MINGVLNIYKEPGFSSHDVVAKLRGIVKQKKIGHTGTLDPAAEGVLPVCLGNATKVCELLTDWDKTYETILLLGCTTDTQDTTGKILREKPVEIGQEQVREAILSFQGAYAQVPPMYSALKVGGKKLYELAREGKEVERRARMVQIYQLEILEISLPRVRIGVTCSKGTYIRTLCHDIGELLGCGGCMESLVRTRVGHFLAEEGFRLSDIQALKEKGRLEEGLIAVDKLFPSFDRRILKPEGDRFVYNGNPFGLEHIQDRQKPAASGAGAQNEETLIYDSKERFVAIYRFVPKEQLYRPVKMFLERDVQG